MFIVLTDSYAKAQTIQYIYSKGLTVAARNLMFQRAELHTCTVHPGLRKWKFIFYFDPRSIIYHALNAADGEDHLDSIWPREP